VRRVTCDACAPLQDDKFTTASTLVRAAEKLAPCPGWEGPAVPAAAAASAAAAAAAAASVPTAAALHPACPLCRLPVVLSLDFRHSHESGPLGEPLATVCYSCKVMRAG